MSTPRMVWSLCFVVGVFNAAYGDMAPMRRGAKRPVVAPAKIVEGKVDALDPDAVAKIVIPRSLVPDLRNLLADRNDPYYVPPVSGESSFDATTCSALALLVAAFILMFVNKKSQYWKWGVIGVFGCVVVLMLASLFFRPKFIPTEVDQSKPQSQIVIEVQKDGHEVILVLPNRK